jgi:hypothetical protein
MQYSHQAQLSEIAGLPSLGEGPAMFWSGNAQYLIEEQYLIEGQYLNTARDAQGWSLVEFTGPLVGEFVADATGYAIVDYDGGEMARFDNWRSAIRHMLRRGPIAD